MGGRGGRGGAIMRRSREAGVDSSAMDSRRDVLRKIGVALAAGSALGAAPAGADGPPADASPGDGPVGGPSGASATSAPEALLLPYVVGSEIGGWTVAALSGVAAGAVAIDLACRDGRARVHLCARGEPSRGIASTSRFDLVLMNGGDGATPSREDVARVVRVLAARIDSNTEAALQLLPELGGLLTHDQRLARFASAGGGCLA